MIHTLKCWPEPFELIRLGVKTAEVRSEGGGQNRRFNAGDVLLLQEFDPRKGYTGRTQTAHVTDLLRTYETPSEWQLQSAGGIVVMSLRLVAESPTTERSGFCNRCGGKRWCPGCDR